MNQIELDADKLETIGMMVQTLDRANIDMVYDGLVALHGFDTIEIHKFICKNVIIGMKARNTKGRGFSCFDYSLCNENYQVYYSDERWSPVSAHMNKHHKLEIENLMGRKWMYEINPNQWDENINVILENVFCTPITHYHYDL